MKKPEDHWLSQANMARSCKVSLSAFQKWNVQPVAKIGRTVYYSVGDVSNNRLDHEFLGPGSDLAKSAPSIAEYVLQRIAKLEAKLAKLT